MKIDKMTLNEIWQVIDQKANEHPEYIQEIDAVYKFDITGTEGNTYGLVIKDGKAEVVKDGKVEADCTLTMNVDNFKKLLQGNLNSATALMTGRLKVKGNMGLALKLESILKKYSF